MTRRIEDDPQTDTQTNKDNGTHTQMETGMIDKTNTDRHFLFQNYEALCSLPLTPCHSESKLLC